jgi:hypothetical protein
MAGTWMKQRRRVLVVLIALGALVSGASWPAGATSGTVHRVDWTFHDPGLPGMSNFGTCSHPGCVSFDGQTDVSAARSGAPVGSTTYHAELYPSQSDEITWEVTETFTGLDHRDRISWTGRGTGHPSETDSSGRFPMRGTLTLVPGSGTGSFAGMGGTLDLVATASYTGIATPSSTDVAKPSPAPGTQDGTIVGRFGPPGHSRG